VHQQAVATGRITEEDTVDDWTIIGDRHFVTDRIAEYRERLKVSHLIVTRLRIGGVEKGEVEASMAELAELIGTN
jgi:hypothetical protein